MVLVVGPNPFAGLEKSVVVSSARYQQNVASLEE